MDISQCWQVLGCTILYRTIQNRKHLLPRNGDGLIPEELVDKNIRTKNISSKLYTMPVAPDLPKKMMRVITSYRTDKATPLVIKFILNSNCGIKVNLNHFKIC